jgi:hypothetical protein
MKISNKIKVLEGYALKGVAPGKYFPRSVNEFRQWEDRDLGLEVIGSPNTMSAKSSPHNASLIAEATELMRQLKILHQTSLIKSPKKPSQADQLSTIKIQMKATTDALSRVASDWHLTQSELIHAKQESEVLKRRNKDLITEVDTLRKKIIELTSTGLRVVK